MGWTAFDSLSWQSVPMPYSSGPVSLARLPLPSAGFLAFVRFPAGWSRSTPVVYEATEEFVILEGELRINHRCWAARSYGCVPAGLIRRITESPAGCLAWARFHGSPRVSQADPGAVTSTAGESSAPLITTPLADPTAEAPSVQVLCLTPAGQTERCMRFDEHDNTLVAGVSDALALDDFGWWTRSCTGTTIRHRKSAAIIHRISEVTR